MNNIRHERKGDSPLLSIWGSDCHLTQGLTQYSDALSTKAFDSISLPLEMGEYIVNRLVGKGGMGCVFQGEHRRMQRRVAIKILTGASSNQADSQELFLREVRAVARLLHPNIVTAFDAGQFGAIAYLVMEYIDGSTLSQLVDSAGPLSPRIAVDYLQQAALGLQHAHDNNVVHRDVKPGNIMIAAGGTIKILDLGLATLVRESFATGEGQAKKRFNFGTPEFMAPEQFEANQVDERSDVYGLGCTFFYLLTGACPYRGNFLELMREHTSAPIPKLSRFSSRFPSDLQRLLEFTMAKDAEERPQSMHALIDLLRALDIPGEDSGPKELVRGSDVSRVFGTNTERVSKSAVMSCLGIDMGQRYVTAAFCSSNAQLDRARLRGLESSTMRSSVLLDPSQNIHLGINPQDFLNARSHGLFFDLHEFVRTQEVVKLGSQQVPSFFLLGFLLEGIHAKLAANKESQTVAFAAPASFSQAQRAAMIQAGRICGFQNTRIIDRSTMAVLSEWSKSLRKPQKWLVVELSDLTMEVSVFSVGASSIQMLSTAGDPSCRRPRWSRRIKRWLLQKLSARSNSNVPEDFEASEFELSEAIEHSLEQLASNSTTDLNFSFNGKKYSSKLEDTILIRRCHDLVERLGILVGTALSDADVDGDEISRCLTIGTLPRIAPLKRMLSNMGLGCPFASIEQAAIADATANFGAYGMNGESLPRLATCNANSIALLQVDESGRETDRRMLLPRLTALPASLSESFQFRSDGRKSTIKIVELETVDGSRWQEFLSTQLSSAGAVVAEVFLDGDAVAKAFLRNGVSHATCDSKAVRLRTDLKYVFDQLASKIARS